MPQPNDSRLQYDPTATKAILPADLWDDLAPQLLAARDETLADVELLHSGNPVPAEKEPLDAGFIELPRELLDEAAVNEKTSLLERIETTAAGLRKDFDRVVVLGIGGSHMGMRALFEALRHPYHNELKREQRDGLPRLTFQGNNLDNDASQGLLDLLAHGNRERLEDRWGVIVISKSGSTLETAVAFRLFRDALEQLYGADSDECRRFIVPVTGEAGKLRALSNEAGYQHVFPIPDDVGGRFSVFTAVGLLPAAVLGLDVRRLLAGAADMTDRFRNEPPGQNPVLDYVATGHLCEHERGLTTRVLSTWGGRLEAVGLWYDQLLSESLGKHEQGATPITVVNTRDLHSRGQQHQEGRRDKLITNVVVDTPSSTPLALPSSSFDQDNLNRLAGRTMPEFLTAAIAGTNQAYADADRPTADIRLPCLDEFALGHLLQMLMLATVVEGRLVNINPDGQPGVEAYLRNMQAKLDRS